MVSEKAIQVYYKGRGNWVDWLIRLWTWSKYSHTEIIIDGTWYSSSPRDGGARAKIINFNPDHWDFEEIQINRDWALQVFEQYEGKGYDFTGILFSHVLPFGWHCKKRVFCSELNAKMRQLPKDPHWYSPKRICKHGKSAQPSLSESR